MVFIRLFLDGNRKEKMLLRLAFANQNWWFKECINAKILTNAKDGVDKYKKSKQNTSMRQYSQCFNCRNLYYFRDLNYQT